MLTCKSLIHTFGIIGILKNHLRFKRWKFFINQRIFFNSSKSSQYYQRSRCIHILKRNIILRQINILFLSECLHWEIHSGTTKDSINNFCRSPSRNLDHLERFVLSFYKSLNHFRWFMKLESYFYDYFQWFSTRFKSWWVLVIENSEGTQAEPLNSLYNFY